MPYLNEYNRNIAAQLQGLYQRNISHQNAMDDNLRQNDVMSPLEGLAMREENISGGNGTVAATLHDLGYEQMNGTTGSGEPPVIKKRTYKRKPKPEVVHLPTADVNPNVSATAGGVSAGGMSAGGVSGGGDADRQVGGGMSAGNDAPVEKKRRAPRKPKETPAAESVVEAAKPKRTNARAAIVGKIMKEKGMKMAEASKYVKEHGLYKSGGALMTLTSLDNMEGNQGPTPFTSGGVPNTKLVHTDYVPVVKAGRKPRAKKTE